MVVDVGVAQRAAGDGVAAHADGGDRTDGVEDLVEESLVDLGEEVADVQRRGGEGVGRSSAAASGGRRGLGHGGGGRGGLGGGRLGLGFGGHGFTDFLFI